jgi:hypothetical protein
VLLTSLCLFVLSLCCSIFIHCAAAVPAYHLRRPVKAILDRDEDMQMTGAAMQPYLISSPNACCAAWIFHNTGAAA